MSSKWSNTIWRNLPRQPRRHPHRPCFLQIEEFRVQPQLALSIPLFRVNVNWLLAFVGVEENPPSADKKDCRHFRLPHGPSATYSSRHYNTLLPGTQVLWYRRYRVLLPESGGLWRNEPINVTMPFAKKALKSLLRIAAGVPVVSILLGSLLYLALSVTWTGRCVLSGAIFGGVLFCSIGYWNRSWFQRIRRRFFTVLVPIGLAAYLVPMLLAPSDGNADPRVQSRCLQGKRSFPRMAALQRHAGSRPDQRWHDDVPDVRAADQLRPGPRMRSLMRPLYAEMDRDPAFRDLGSAPRLGLPRSAARQVRQGTLFRRACPTRRRTTRPRKSTPLPDLLARNGGRRQGIYLSLVALGTRKEVRRDRSDFRAGELGQSGRRGDGRRHRAGSGQVVADRSASHLSDGLLERRDGRHPRQFWPPNCFRG